MIVFEHDDLIAIGNPERARIGQERTRRQPLAKYQPGRRREWIVFRTYSRRHLRRVQTERFLDDPSDRSRNRTGNHACAQGADQRFLRLGRRLGAQGPKLGILQAGVLAEEQRDDVDLGEGRIRTERQRDAIRCSIHAHRDAIRLRRDANTRFGLDVEKRFDATGGVEKIDAAACDEVTVALEHDVAALDLGVSEQQGLLISALQLELGTRDDVGDVVFHAQRRRRVDLEVESNRKRGRRRRRHQRRRSPAQLEDVRVQLEPPAQTASRTVTMPPTIGDAALPRSHISASTSERNPSG